MLVSRLEAVVGSRSCFEASRSYTRSIAPPLCHSLTKTIISTIRAIPGIIARCISRGIAPQTRTWPLALRKSAPHAGSYAGSSRQLDNMVAVLGEFVGTFLFLFPPLPAPRSPACRYHRQPRRGTLQTCSIRPCAPASG